jgi:FAD-dependent oxidoreductase domain-containing protein 1
MRRTISLLKHSTTKSSYDVIIMGGGAMGSSAAFHLSQKEPTMKILCVEKDFSYKINSAMLSCGGIRQQFSCPENILMSIYGIEFLKNMKQLEVNGDIPDIQYHENGYLFLAKGEHNKIALEDNYKVQLECGASWLKTLDQEGLIKKFPWLNAEDILLGTTSDKNEGYFDPWSYVNAMKKKSISVGVDYLEGEVVNATLEGSTSSPASSAKITSIDIKLSNGDIQKVSGNTYVNTAGAWGGKLVDIFAKNAPNPNGIATLPVFPRKRNVFLVHCREKDHPIPPPLAPLTVDPTGIYFRPEGQGGRYICGASPVDGEEDPDCEGNY